MRRYASAVYAVIVCPSVWRRDVMVTALVVSTKLLYVEPGYYWDGWPCSGSTPAGGTLFRYV